MKTLGIIGGIAPESTIEYYRRIIALYRERRPDGGYPTIIINSIDLKRMLKFVDAADLAGLTGYLLEELMKLAHAGAKLGLLASNTPHLVFEELRRKSPIPLVSIVEATCEAAQALGLKRLGLFGTRSTMQARFYPKVFSRRGITVIPPDPQEREYIHDRYMGELVQGVFRSETRDGLLEIADRLKKRDGIKGLILGGTELPLLFRESAYAGIPFLNTTAIHVEKAISLLFAEKAAPRTSAS